MCTTVFLPVRALNCDTEYSMYVQHNLRVDETAISIKFRVDEMKGIVTNVATHRGDIEKMVEKIIEVGWLVTDDLCDIRVIIDI